MVSAADVPADVLIAAVAEDLKKSMKMPKWALFVKTGAGRQRPPQQEDWWWTRAAAILRQVYLHGPVGVNRLRTVYANRKDRGVRPEKVYRAGGKIIREMLKELEALGYIKKVKKGREMTPKGQSYLDKKVPGFGKKEETPPKEEKKPEVRKEPTPKEVKPSKEAAPPEKQPEAKPKAPEPKKETKKPEKPKEAKKPLKKEKSEKKKETKKPEKKKPEAKKKPAPKAKKKVKGVGKAK